MQKKIALELTVVCNGIALVYKCPICTLKCWHLCAGSKVTIHSLMPSPSVITAWFTHFSQGKFRQELWRSVRLPQHKLRRLTNDRHSRTAVLRSYKCLCCSETIRICVEGLQIEIRDAYECSSNAYREHLWATSNFIPGSITLIKKSILKKYMLV